MTYTAQNGRVTLEMTPDEFSRLLLALGYAAGAASKSEDKRMFWDWIELANEVNSGNPNFIPYEIPDLPDEQRPFRAPPPR